MVMQAYYKTCPITAFTRVLTLCSLLICCPAMHLALAQKVRSPIPSTNVQPGVKWIEAFSVTLEMKSARMVDILAAIHAQTGVALAADDAPLIQKTDLTFRGPLKTALDRIADAFDYRWFPSKSVPKAILLQKRFKSNDDHPQFQQKDMLHIAGEVCRCLQNPLYVPGMVGEPRELFQILYHKLRDDQIRRLQSGQQLTIGDLDQSQQLLLYQSIHSMALKGITDGWVTLREQLSNLVHSRLEMKVYSGTRCLTLVLPASNGPDQTINLRFFPSTGIDASPEIYESAALGGANPSPPTTISNVEASPPLAHPPTRSSIGSLQCRALFSPIVESLRQNQMPR